MVIVFERDFGVVADDIFKGGVEQLANIVVKLRKSDIVAGGTNVTYLWLGRNIALKAG